MSLLPAELRAAAERLGQACRRAGIAVALAESCTGGLVGAALTSIPGSSGWFERGFVTYSNLAKTELLGVPAALIEAHGAVSAEVALAMAEGALAHSQARAALAITGIAGPDGGSPTKPVGTVHLAAARQDRPILHQACLFSGDRDQVRLAAALAGLALLTMQLS